MVAFIQWWHEVIVNLIRHGLRNDSSDCAFHAVVRLHHCLWQDEVNFQSLADAYSLECSSFWEQLLYVWTVSYVEQF